MSSQQCFSHAVASPGWGHHKGTPGSGRSWATPSSPLQGPRCIPNPGRCRKSQTNGTHYAGSHSLSQPHSGTQELCFPSLLFLFIIFLAFWPHPLGTGLSGSQLPKMPFLFIRCAHAHCPCLVTVGDGVGYPVRPEPQELPFDGRVGGGERDT